MEEGSGMNLGGCVKNVKRNAVSLTRDLKSLYFDVFGCAGFPFRLDFHTASLNLGNTGKNI